MYVLCQGFVPGRGAPSKWCGRGSNPHDVFTPVVFETTLYTDFSTAPICVFYHFCCDLYQKDLIDKVQGGYGKNALRWRQNTSAIFVREKSRTRQGWGGVMNTVKSAGPIRKTGRRFTKEFWKTKDTEL